MQLRPTRSMWYFRMASRTNLCGSFVTFKSATLTSQTSFMFPAMDVIPRFGILATKSKSCWTSGEASSRTFMVNTFSLYRGGLWFKILTTASGYGWVWGGVFVLFVCGRANP